MNIVVNGDIIGAVRGVSCGIIVDCDFSDGLGENNGVIIGNNDDKE